MMISSRSLFSTLLLITARLANAQLDPAAVDAHLAAGEALLGPADAVDGNGDANLANWMADVDDATLLADMNIPGTHDSLAWNVTGFSASFIETQSTPLFPQLQAGARFLDIRVGIVGEDVRLYHGSELLDTRAVLNDILYGIYHWLDAHPTETVLVSIKVDNGDPGAAIQTALMNSILAPETQEYWVQSNVLPTLGEARHKAVLIRRFVFDAVPDIALPGINLSAGFEDNNPAFTIPYSEDGIAYIQDFYNVGGDDLAGAIDSKWAAMSTHLDLAGGQVQLVGNQFFLGYASGTSGLIANPKTLAQGNGADVTTGVNQRVVEYMADHAGAHYGVVVFDFYGDDERLGLATLGREVDTAPLPPSSTGTGASPTQTSRNNGSGASSITVSLGLSAALFSLSIIML